MEEYKAGGDVTRLARAVFYSILPPELEQSRAEAPAAVNARSRENAAGEPSLIRN